MRAACLVALTACAISLPIPTERMPIKYVGRGNLEKGGVPLDGFTCGETYETAVAGVPDAEAEMRTCWRYNALYGGGILGAIAFASAAIVTRRYTDSAPTVDLELGMVAATFLVGYISAFLAGHHLNHAIELYNNAVR